ncbi:MAG: sigma-70 family RNA polymerase sigma factor [Proteobacteria bacterium]|nr:sigma-70 family RNA polymerase sigma factor [Pseudomonadota bacterium]
MTEKEILAERFEASRAHLRSVAYRMLGSGAEADDAVQETFLRFMRAGSSGIDNFSGWLTTIVARVCLDMLRERKSRHEVPVDAGVETLPAANNPERETLIADSVGVAMLVVLETLTPAERVAFVLHDMFNFSFDEIAPVVGRSPAAVRQLASRGRRRVQGAPAQPEADRTRQREVIDAFLAASRSGDFAALLAILDPGVVLRADAAAVQASLALASQDVPILAPEIRGRDAVANIFRGRAKAAQLALLDGDYGFVFAPGGSPRVAADFVLENGRIVEISLIADPERIAARDIEF